MKDLLYIQTGLTLSAETASETALSVSIATSSDEPFLSERGQYIFSDSAEGETLIFALGKTRDTNAFRCLGGDVIKRLQATKTEDAFVDFPADMTTDEIGAFLEGMLLGAFNFERYKSEKSAAPVTVTIELKYAALLAEKQGLCDAVNMARDWAHEPAAVINPHTLTDRAEALAKEFGLGFRVLTDMELRDMGAGAIVAVGQGSKTPSRMIILSYPGKKQTDPIVLVGKAITFDSGGYSIKPTDSMVGMKYDKCGAMAVLGTIRAAAVLGLDTPIVAIICAAENMLSEKSYRPDDILTSLSGKTIEIISTDAEGRLVLADGLTYAQREYKPKAIVDLATLTGGVMIALGTVRAGLLSNDDALAIDLFGAGERSDEKLWRLPLDDEYRELIKGKDADIKNSGGRNASTITGGMFLKEFVPDEVPWAHIDIAAVADNKDGLAYSAPGATGFGVRLLIDWLQNASNDENEE